MNLPHIKDHNLIKKTVLLRADLDIPLKDQSRLNSLQDTLAYLETSQTKAILIGHRGRPAGKPNSKLSLLPLAQSLQSFFGKEVKFIFDLNPPQIKDALAHLTPGQIILLENLRFYPGEEANDPKFAQNLASLGDFYINEAFASSHRSHASIVTIPKFLPHAAGFHFIKEVENLNRILKSPQRPLIFIIGGAKKEKLNYLSSFKKFADKILVAHKLSQDFKGPSNDKLLFAQLTPNTLDITPDSIAKFKKQIVSAGTIIVNGPMGKYEDEDHAHGTKEILQAIAHSSAFKVAGGGDTRAAIKKLKLTKNFDWVSTGGGAMLEFFARSTLPGIQALLD